MKAKKNISHTRSIAVLICESVIDHGKSLGEAIDIQLNGKDISPIDRSFIQSLSFGVIRWYWQLESELNPLLNKPLRNKERLVKYILLIGIFQIQHLNTPAHAAVSDTVKCCQKLGKQWAKNLVNACLRNFLREGNTTFDPTKNTHHAHPNWLYDQIENAWPEYKKEILSANNQAAPLCLRVNKKVCTRQDYLELLTKNNIQAIEDPYSDIGIRLSQSLAVSALPSFAEGWASVQDTSSQMVAQILDVQNNQRVLDACAAPGGKTSLILENAPNTVTMHALDISANRNNRLQDTLNRLKLTSTIISADARNVEWWDEVPYQRILVDAPCSGLGVIRRHPDIKHLRKESDLKELNQSQMKILNSCWHMLDKDGLLLYTTCSILPAENVEIIKSFLEKTPDAKVMPIKHPTAINQEYGYQSLPGVSDMDGFYYCLLKKHTK